MTDPGDISTWPRWARIAFGVFLVVVFVEWVLWCSGLLA